MKKNVAMWNGNFQFPYSKSKVEYIQKTSWYTDSSHMDLAGACFRIWSKKKFGMKKFMKWKPWAAQFSYHFAFTLLSNKSCMNFELPEFLLSPKYVHLKALLYSLHTYNILLGKPVTLIDTPGFGVVDLKFELKTIGEFF